MDIFFRKKKNPESPVQIAVAPNEVVASIWRDVLAENGIRCLMQSINLVASMYTAPITLQFRIMVMPQEAEKAREVLGPFLELPDEEAAADSGTDNGSVADEN